MWKSELRQSFPKLGNPHLSDREGQRCSEAVLNVKNVPCVSVLGQVPPIKQEKTKSRRLPTSTSPSDVCVKPVNTEAGTLMSLKLRTCDHAIGLPELIFTAPGVFGRRLR